MADDAKLSSFKSVISFVETHGSTNRNTAVVIAVLK